MLGGLLVWAAHFFTLYAAASIFETSAAARLITAAATLAAVAGNLLLFRAVRRRASADPFADWARSLARLAIGVSMIAVLWQGLPALLA